MVFHNLSMSPYAGPPSPEIDAAWSNLLAPMHIRVSEAELRRDNQESVRLPEGGGYLGWMGAFHELHCIVSGFPQNRKARILSNHTDIYCAEDATPVAL